VTLPSAKPLLHGLTRERLGADLAETGQPAYRLSQVWSWLYIQRARDWAAMTNLPAALRTALDARYDLSAGEIRRSEGEAGQTRKLVVGLRDGEAVETVLIPAADRRTVCVSSQCGCRFACAFCASGQAGFSRDLEPGEIVTQVLLAWDTFGEKPTHVVFMGIGEPLDNYDAVLAAIRILNDADGIGIGARRLTVSTSGLVPGIRRLSGEGLQVELSVSLHAADDELRSRLMPINRRHGLDELLPACRAYTEATGRIITFEYTMIAGVNDTPMHVRQLVERLRSFPCRVNLIPLSEVREFDGQPSGRRAVQEMLAALDQAGINATLRDSKGSTIRAACGQLRYAKTAAQGAPTP